MSLPTTFNPSAARLTLATPAGGPADPTHADGHAQADPLGSFQEGIPLAVHLPVVGLLVGGSLRVGGRGQPSLVDTAKSEA